MDWQAFQLSISLALCSVAILIPFGILLGHYLARSYSLWNQLLKAVFALPLVLPPTVMGYYLLVSMGRDSWLSQIYVFLFHEPLAFSFQGILLGSLIFNLPFAFIPIQRALEDIPEELKDAARTCGLSHWQSLFKIELPLAWKGILSAVIMTFAHTLGEFGVILMVGGNIPGQTRTLSIAIYDKVQGLEMGSAGLMSIFLVLVAFGTLLLTQLLATTKDQKPKAYL
ncbi:MAG: molybdate ABC transporter permease subunit [Betaproteobacteria bacterium]|jgi:molybdate transport system permease protein